MHGRLKVKSTAEQLEAKRKERQKKLQLYTAATSKIFSKKQKGELDEEMLKICGEVLSVNPDFYTLWNYRKEVFQSLRQSMSLKALEELFVAELGFLQMCLKINPKSYGTWHHRCFVMDAMSEPDWAREMELCNQFLKYDDRNFHCWDYRRFVVTRANISPEEELEYSLGKISNNFSNYSSWHYRSKLLPVVFSDKTQPMDVSEEALLKEYELVQNGLFTDPDDQSNWFYYRWLLGRGKKQQAIDSVTVSLPDQSVTVSFLQHIKVGTTADIILKCNGSPLKDVSWVNQDMGQSFSTLWIGRDVSVEKDSNCDLSVHLVIKDAEVCAREVHVEAGSSVSRRWLPGTTSSRFSHGLSAVKRETLEQELESLMQLMEVETNNKWAMLTAVQLMRALDPVKFQKEIMNHLLILEELDLKRAEYFRDLRSKFTMEDAIDAMDRGERSAGRPPLATFTLDLQGQNLTKLYHLELLTLVTAANLCDNNLRDLRGFNLLRSLRELRLNHNRVTSCQGLQGLPRLETLFLCHNLLSSPESLAPLQACPSLKVIHLSGNPVAEQEAKLNAIRELLSGVQIVADEVS